MARYENGVYYNDDGSIFDPSSLFGGGGGFAPAPVQQPQRSFQQAQQPANDQNLIDTIRQYSQGASQQGQSNYLNSLLGQGYSQDYLTGLIRQATGDQGFTADDFNYLRNYQAPAPTQAPMQPTQAPVMAAPAPMPVAMAPTIASTMAPTSAPYDLENFNRYRQQAGLLTQGQGLLGAAYDDPFATNEARVQGQSLLDQANALQVDRGRVQSDLLRAIQNGEDLNPYYGDTYDDSLRLLSDLGINRGGKDAQRILDASPTGYSGAWKFDPVFGSEYYKDYVSQVGQQLGLSQEQINKAAGQFAADTLYNPQGKGFDGGIGDPKFLTDLTRRVIDASGQNSYDPKFTSLLQSTGQTAGQLANQLYSESDSSGVLKQYLNRVILTPEVLGTAAILGGLSAAGIGYTGAAEGAAAAGAGAGSAGVAEGLGAFAPVDYSLGSTLVPGATGVTGLTVTPEIAASFGLGGGADLALGSGLLSTTLPNAASVGGLGAGLTVPTILNGTAGTITAGGFVPTGTQLGLGSPNSIINAGTSNFNGTAQTPSEAVTGVPSGASPATTPTGGTGIGTGTGTATGIKGLLDGFSTGNAIVDKLLGGLLGGAILSQLSGAGGSQQQGTPYTPITPKQYSINPVVQRYTGDPTKYGESDIGNFRFYNSGLLG